MSRVEGPDPSVAMYRWEGEEMSHQTGQALRSLLEERVVAICRVDDSAALMSIVDSLHRGGLSCIEITMTTPDVLQAITRVASELKEVSIGAGTVLDGETARQAILAGAEFLVTPTVARDAILVARRYGIPVIVGAMTPTEIQMAWEAGADFVKVFPADVLGPAFIKALMGPLPQIPLAPTGGITAGNAGEYIAAGAAIVCAGGWLVDAAAIARGDFEELTKRARELVTAVKRATDERGI
jgi:2-dehydro-3-deoxyphosphogluconate aldolase/(4S)-4-hydroxy-2-oxoglutarate aldolase